MKRVKEQGLLNIGKMTTGQWYRALLENNITMQVDADGRSSLRPCKVEIANPRADWAQTWQLASLRDLSSEDQTFLWRMLHDILPTQYRLHRLGMRNAPTPNCLRCDSLVPESLTHALVTCQKNSEVAAWFLPVVHQHLPGLQPQQLVQLDLGTMDESMRFPMVWLISNVFSLLWQSKKEKKVPNLFQTRAMLEARVTILRKTRINDHCTMIDTMIN